MGRKRISIKEDSIKIIKELASKGLNRQNIAEYLGISLSTLERRMEEDPEIEKAMKQGRAKSVLAVAGTAFQMATSGRYPNMTQFWLKTQGGWTEEESESETEFTFKLAYDPSLPPPSESGFESSN